MLSLKVVIPDEVMQKIMWWIFKSNHEVSGFGSLDFDPKTGTFTVRDAILLKQEVGPASTEIDPISIGKAMYEMRDQPNALKWHWHSHVDMSVFWSQDDKDLIKNLGSQGWIVASVFNKKREMKSAFYALVETKFGEIVANQELFLEDIGTHVQRYIAADEAAAWDKQYEEHVSVQKAAVYVPGHYFPTTELMGFVRCSKDRTNRPKPTGNNYAYEFDKEGFKWSWKFERWTYNPIYDEELQEDPEAIEAMILTMDDEEVDIAYNYYDDKEKLFKQYYDEVFEEFMRPEEVEQDRTNSVLHLPCGLGG